MSEIPYGYCHCGCGEKTNLIRIGNRRRGLIPGEPYRYLNGHASIIPRDRWYVVDPETGCWLWQLARISTGYGTISRDGRTQLAHRVLYEEHVGPIPKGLQLDHLCRTPLCVNPSHLEPVTNATNSRRGARAKLSLAAAREIRASVLSTHELADRFGVSVETIYGVRHGRVWREDDERGRAA